MKKIVALVLNLVMVLGLAATASAASLSSVFGGIVNPTDASAMWDAKLVVDDAENAKDSEFATDNIEMTAKATGETAWWDDTITSEKGETEDFEVGNQVRQGCHC